MVASGQTEVGGDTGDVETVDFETLFELQISQRLAELFDNYPSLPTKIILVPSLNDAFHDFVYPQPPYIDRIPG